MKLLHIIASMNPVSGGPCQGIRNSNPDMIQLGVYREVVCLDDPSSPYLGMDDFPVHALGPGKGVWQYSAKLKPWLMENLHRFEVVVINGLWLYSSYAGWSAMRSLKKLQKNNPTVALPKMYIMPHGMLDPYFQRAPDRKLKAIRNFFYWKFIESRVVNEADGLLFTCEVELQLAGAAFKPYKPKRKINVGYGIIKPPEQTDAMYNAFIQSRPDMQGESYLLYLSRINEKKGVDLLINAYAILLYAALAENRTIPKLVIAGPGINTPYGQKILGMASATTSLHNAVVFTGMLTGDAKWGAIYNCDAFILPSHQENFGIAVVEALACSRPVLISKEINIWLEIKHGGAGIVEDDTYDGTTAMLQQWLCLSDTDKVAMSKNALNVYEKHFNVRYASIKFFKAISVAL
jgi:glycosyltransferase involved in cell wall biosynthesis